MLPTLRVLAAGCSALIVVWGAAALFYRLNLSHWALYSLIAVFAALALAGVIALWLKPWLGVLGLVALFGALGSWWVSLKPSNDRVWADDVARPLTGTIQGDSLTLNQVRNFLWQSDEQYQINWESRQYDLTKLKTVDVITSYWGMEAVAHVLVSFGFSDGEYLAFSVEIRRERHEVYSELGGFFKEYELSIIAADERDIVQVRSNVRDEDLYLYRLNMGPKMARALLESYVAEANKLANEPRFYHTLTANCTTVVYHMAKGLGEPLPFDYRLLLTGYLPGYLESIGALYPMPLDELKAQGRITDKARAADQHADFSVRIRQGIPGID